MSTGTTAPTPNAVDAVDAQQTRQDRLDGFFFAPSDDSLLLPYWAITDPESSEAS